MFLFELYRLIMGTNLNRYSCGVKYASSVAPNQQYCVMDQIKEASFERNKTVISLRVDEKVMKLAL